MGSLLKANTSPPLLSILVEGAADSTYVRLGRPHASVGQPLWLGSEESRLRIDNFEAVRLI